MTAADPERPPMPLAGRVAVVSGGGRGLGRAFCLALARQGARIVVNNRNRVVDGDGLGPADHVVAEIRACGGSAVASYADVASPSAGEDMVGAALAQWAGWTSAWPTPESGWAGCSTSSPRPSSRRC